MTSVVLQFLVAAGVIVVAASLLSRFADEVAERTGLGRLLIGSILLASATSLPELSFCVSAARRDAPDLAVGDLLGSCLFNLLNLGMIDLLPGTRGRVLARISVAHALPATLSIALVSLTALAILTGAKADFFGLGVGSLAILLAYGYGLRLVYLDQRLALPTHAGAAGGKHTLLPADGGRDGLLRPLLGFATAAVVIFVAAPRLAEAADVLAEKTGLGGTFVGMTLVAIATTLPEVVTSISAVRIGAPDLALGNVFGSNVFNIVLFVPVDLAYPGSLFAAVSSTHAIAAMTVILITSIVVMGQLYQAEVRVRLLEPDGVLVIGLVLASLAMVYLMR